MGNLISLSMYQQWLHLSIHRSYCYFLCDLVYQKSAQANINTLKTENQGLYTKVDNLSSTIYELDAERTRLSENQLDELENNYLVDLKDARSRLANTQDETAKLKLEYFN